MAYQQPQQGQQQQYPPQYGTPVQGQVAYSPPQQGTPYSPPQQGTPYSPPQQGMPYAPPQQQQQQQQVQHVIGYQTHPQMQPHVVQVAKPKDWQNSLFDCSPCDSCLLGTFLPCLLLGKTSERMRDQTLQTYDQFNTDCLMFLGIHCLTGCGWIYVMMKRSEIRERFGIDGDGMSDCCTTYWCACCALIQQDKEVEARMPSGNVQVQQYQAQPGMQMPSGKQ